MGKLNPAATARALLLVTTLALQACAASRTVSPVIPDPTASDTSVVQIAPPAPKPETPEPSITKQDTSVAKVVLRPSVPDTTALPATPPPEPPPSVMAQLSPEERAAREAQYRDDVERAERALNLVLGHELTQTQREQQEMADRFLADARQAYAAADLTRACTVAEKARVIAEELSSSISPP